MIKPGREYFFLNFNNLLVTGGAVSGEGAGSSSAQESWVSSDLVIEVHASCMYLQGCGVDAVYRETEGLWLLKALSVLSWRTG